MKETYNFLLFDVNCNLPLTCPLKYHQHCSRTFLWKPVMQGGILKKSKYLHCTLKRNKGSVIDCFVGCFSQSVKTV